MPQDFDLFLSHNSADKALVRQLDQLLRDKGLHPWLDERELLAGRPWQQGLEEGIRASLSAAVLLGPAGLGPWHQGEMEALLDLARREGKTVIPVLLPGFSEQPPILLRAFTQVDLRNGLSGPELERLIAGIRGEPAPPHRPTPPTREYRLEIERSGDGHKAR